MANVTFHRTSKKQEQVKAFLVEQGKRTVEQMNAYKGVILGDDDSVILTRPATVDEMETVQKVVPSATRATVGEVFALVNGRVKRVDHYAEISLKIDL